MKRKYVLIGISVLIVVCIIVIVCTFGCNYSRINGGSPALLINSVNAEPGEKDVKVGIEIKNNRCGERVNLKVFIPHFFLYHHKCRRGYMKVLFHTLRLQYH